MARRARSGDGLQVEGLDEVNRALRNISKDAQRELTAANKKVAEFVADDTRAGASALGGVAAKAAGSVRAAGGTTWAGVSIGGPGYDFAAGAAFGGQGRPTTQQFLPHRGRIGYFLYPQIRQDAERIEREYSEALDDLIRRNRLA